ncbi:putative s-acyltransferase, partial [Globisporangium splendens]
MRLTFASEQCFLFRCQHAKWHENVSFLRAAPRKERRPGGSADRAGGRLEHAACDAPADRHDGDAEQQAPARAVAATARLPATAARLPVAGNVDGHAAQMSLCAALTMMRTLALTIGCRRCGDVSDDVLRVWCVGAAGVHAEVGDAAVHSTKRHGRALVYNRTWCIVITFLDPAHPAVTRRQKQDRAAQQHPTQDSRLAAAEDVVAIDDTTFPDRPSPSRRIKCTLCRVFVSTGTRHCSTCNKCIAGFDHHCVYLNTCIGSRNYPLFIGLLSCTILLISTQMIVTGFAIARLAHAGSRHHAARIASLCCLSLLPFLQLFCMLVLASFHVYLSVKGVRTHECLQQWYRSRAESSASTSSATHHQQQGEEKQKAVVVRVNNVNSINKSAMDRCAGSDASSTDLESSGALEEEEACEQVDTSHACEPMSILMGPEDHLFDGTQQHESDERQKYLV